MAHMLPWCLSTIPAHLRQNTPIALEEACAATKWIAENGQTLNLDSPRLAVAGDSVGGNMETSVALLSKNVANQHWLSTAFIPGHRCQFWYRVFYIKYQDGIFLNREAMKWFWANYLANDTNINEPTVSPLQASVGQLDGLPPSLIMVGENDVLRDVWGGSICA